MYYLVYFLKQIVIYFIANRKICPYSIIVFIHKRERERRGIKNERLKNSYKDDVLNYDVCTKKKELFFFKEKLK